MVGLTVEQITAIRCAHADLVGARQAKEQMDLGAHDWKAHDLSIAELETAFPFVLQDAVVTRSLPGHAPVSAGQIDPTDAPEGCIAVPYTDCRSCALTDARDCHKGQCFADERKDGQEVQFKRLPE